MNPYLSTAALLLVVVSGAHSVLGERYILTRLFRGDLPRLLGGTSFTRRTLRFAWHLTSVAWLGLAAVLLVLPKNGRAEIGVAVAATFAVHFLVALIASRGRHLSWLLFLAVTILILLGTRA